MELNGQQAQLDGFDWQHNVLQSEEINAWCMPGGQIAFYEGIMPVCADNNGLLFLFKIIDNGCKNAKNNSKNSPY